MRKAQRYLIGASALVAFLLSIAPIRAAIEEQQPPSKEERDHCAQSYDQKRDLNMLRDLDQRVQRGELSERERQLLWQAYLARVSSFTPSLDESEGKRRDYDARCGLGFVGPAF